MFLVTGANGALFGRPVLDQLRRLAPDAGIVAGTRDPGSAPELAQTGYGGFIWPHHDGLTWPHPVAVVGGGMVVSA
jgi:uncharacterized protein YbjT (DUF2867 family)